MVRKIEQTRFWNSITICRYFFVGVKLNFGPMRDQVKSQHFQNKRKETIFSLFIQISWNNQLEVTWKTLLEIDLDFLLTFKQPA